MQQEIARAVAESLKVTLLGSQIGRRKERLPTMWKRTMPTFRATFYLQRRNLEDYRKAVGYFDQAIRLVPDYALAYTERSEAWSFIGDLTGQHEPAWSKCAQRCGKGRRHRT